MTHVRQCSSACCCDATDDMHYTTWQFAWRDHERGERRRLAFKFLGGRWPMAAMTPQRLMAAMTQGAPATTSGFTMSLPSRACLAPAPSS